VIDGAGAHNYTYDTRDRLTAQLTQIKHTRATRSMTWATAPLRIRVRATLIRPSTGW
jgi:YD repeat-containing protein